MPTTILLADDHPLFRKGLRDLLEEQPGFEIVGEAGNGQEAIDQVKTLSPDVVVMDIAMPDLNGIEATRNILFESPSTRVVALSMHSGKRFVEDMLQAGAAGYILKKSVPEDIVNGLRAVIAGEVFLSPAITDIVVSELKGFLTKSSPEPGKNGLSPILRTKLHRPLIASDMITRAELVSRFEDLRCRPLTVVSAAPGYGKTTLAGLWIDTCDCPYGWLTLDEGDNELPHFLNHLLAAIERAFPGACEATRSRLQTAEVSAASDLATQLVNDLFNIKSPLILVLDDFHRIREKTVYDLMRTLMNHPPPNMHLILLTRRDMPLLTSTLRGRGQINEIGAADLYFTVEETALFLSNATGLSIDAQTAEAVQVHLEGWPAGMRLIAQSLKYSDNLDLLLAGLHGGFATIVDYLWNEVLSHQSPEMVKLMTATATLDCFCASLCDALIKADLQPNGNRMNGDEFIARLQKENLFLVPLDKVNHWFRYHHSFQQLLKKQLAKWWQPEEIAALHAQASTWLAENNATEPCFLKSLAGYQVPEYDAVSDASAAIAPPTHDFPLSPAAYPPLVEPLTNRELDVLSLLVQRLSNKEIADQLYISTTTVKGHLQNIYGKLNVNKRREAIERAKRMGII
jgi:ATP/maltotriose-dependent transcriptional regulator MalT/ActR/RegA family two-component response regulator